MKKIIIRRSKTSPIGEIESVGSVGLEEDDCPLCGSTVCSIDIHNREKRYLNMRINDRI